MNPEGLDLQQLMAAAQQMQEHLLSAQAELNDAEVAGTAGGGLVTARVNGQGEVTSITISPEAIDPGDLADTAETLADLVLAAIRDAYREVADLQQEKMGPLAGGLGGLPGLGSAGEALGGLGIPGLGGPAIPGSPGELPGYSGEPGHDGEPGRSEFPGSLGGG